jgi:hypothetical protein
MLPKGRHNIQKQEITTKTMKTAKQELSEMIADLERKQSELEATLLNNREMVEELKLKANRLTTPERIRVPENIKFEKSCDSFALISPNGKCRLHAGDIHGGIPVLWHAGSEDNPKADLLTFPLYLEPCKREDLKCGDVAYALYVDINDICFANDIKNYVVVLNDDQCVRWNKLDEMVYDNDDYDFWYKVVR